MTTIKQQARMLDAANLDASHVFPDIHEEAMARALKFGQAKGLLEMWLSALDEPKELTRKAMLNFMAARTQKVLEEWK